MNIQELTQEQIREMVDKGAKINAKVKELTEELNKITKTLKNYGKLNNVRVIEGNQYKYEISDSEFLKLDLEVLREVLPIETIWKIVTVSTTQARKEIPKETLENLAVVETKPFYKGQFKEKEDN